MMLYHSLDRDPEHPFYETEHPSRWRYGKQARGRSLFFFRSICMYVECINSTGHICECRIHFFNVIRQYFGEQMYRSGCVGIFSSPVFTILILSKDLNIYMTFLRNYIHIFLLFLQSPTSTLTLLRIPKTVFKSLRWFLRTCHF